MAQGKNSNLGAFGKVFNKNVPHILESIFLSLDYDSFMTCHNVCFAWKYLFMSDSFKEGAEKLLAEKMRREEMIHDSVRSGDIEEVDRLLSGGGTQIVEHLEQELWASIRLHYIRLPIWATKT